MPLDDLLALLILATTMTFTPGPNTVLVTALAARHGLRAALPFCLAVPSGWLLLMAAVAGGVGALVAAEPTLRGALQLVGVAYLLGLAWRLARAPTGPADPAAGRTDAPLGYRAGLLLQFVNLKAWMFALTLSAGWALPRPGETDSALPRLLTVLAVMAFYGFASNFSYALLGAGLRGWLAGGPVPGRRMQRFNRVSAALLAATALWMLGG